MAARLTREQLATNDVESLLLDAKFLRFLSTIRATARIETVAYGPDSRHLHFAEGRRSLWCDILRTVELSSPDALLRILTEEMVASKENSSGRRKYNRLDTSDDGDPAPGSSAGDGLAGYLDYSSDGSA